jgi:hypothetical protein
MIRINSACTLLAALGACVLLCAANVARAHHSFAVFFDTDSKLVKVTGVVREFRFSNPHGVVVLDVKQGGKVVVWRAETNSPSILRRRGWNQQSIHVGETVTIEGWPARDGSNYLRLRAATRANGEPIGTAPTPVREK